MSTGEEIRKELKEAMAASRLAIEPEEEAKRVLASNPATWPQPTEEQLVEIEHRKQLAYEEKVEILRREQLAYEEKIKKQRAVVARMVKILKDLGIEMTVEGGYDLPCITFKYNGETIVYEEACSFTTEEFQPTPLSNPLPPQGPPNESQSS